MIYEKKYPKLQDSRYKIRDWIIDAICIGAIIVVFFSAYLIIGA